MEVNVVLICIWFLFTAWYGKLNADCCIKKIREDRTGEVFAWYVKTAVLLMAVGVCIALVAAVSCLFAPNFWESKIKMALDVGFVYMMASRLVYLAIRDVKTSLKGER